LGGKKSKIMNKTINFLTPSSSPITMEAAQTCNVIIENVEPETEWNIEVIGTNGERTIIPFLGERPKREER